MARKKSAKIEALQDELASIRATLIAEHQNKMRMVEEAAIQQAAELLATERELAEFRAAASAAGRTPGVILDEHEERTEAASAEAYARSLARESGEGREKRYTEAAARHREQTGPAMTTRVVGGRQVVMSENDAMKEEFARWGRDERGRSIG